VVRKEIMDYKVTMDQKSGVMTTRRSNLEEWVADVDIDRDTYSVAFHHNNIVIVPPVDRQTLLPRKVRYEDLEDVVKQCLLVFAKTVSLTAVYKDRIQINNGDTLNITWESKGDGKWETRFPYNGVTYVITATATESMTALTMGQPSPAPPMVTATISTPFDRRKIYQTLSVLGPFQIDWLTNEIYDQ